jgi:hypothetical protein
MNMAYSNWGGTVSLNGKDVTMKQCDATIGEILAGKTLTVDIGKGEGKRLVNTIAKMAALGATGSDDDDDRSWMYHAILGDAGSGLLVGMYKTDCVDIFTVSNGSATKVQEFREMFSKGYPKLPDPPKPYDLMSDRECARWNKKEEKIHEKMLERWKPREEITVDGITIAITFDAIKNRMACTFTDATGKTWIGITGLYYGKGHARKYRG